MRKIAPDVFIENRYPGVILGVIASNGSVLLVDSPLRADDAREWFAQVRESQGQPKYLALLDDHPDRALGARVFDGPRVAHDLTRQRMALWSDAYKGASRPIGAEADRLKRITGVNKAIPELSFAEAMVIHLEGRQVWMEHHPGPAPGAMWVLDPEHKVAFIGDVVVTAEPPYLGEAEVEVWLETLDILRDMERDGYKLVAGRDGLIDREAINSMARFLRKIPHRLERLANKGAPAEKAAALAPVLVRDFRVPASRREQAMLRLRAGLMRLYDRLYPSEE